MKNNKKGMAMIAALMAAFILLALVSTLCLLATSSTRRANYAKKATIALHLAEAGIADAIYRMNYPPYGNYPFDGSAIPVFSGATSSSTATIISGTLEGGSYEVTFEDSDPDKITSTATYKGIKRILSVQIRGKNVVVTPRQDPGQGIPEAFNKHVIYAGTINGSGTYSITGNLRAATLNLLGTASGQYTLTTIPSALSDFCKADTSLSLPSTADLSWTQIFKDEELATSGYQNVGTGFYVGDGGTNQPLISGVSYSTISGTEERYTLNNATIGSLENWLFEGVDTDTPLCITITGTTTMASDGFLKAQRAVETDPNGKGDITLDNCSGTIEGVVKADGDISIINSSSSASNLTFHAGSSSIPANITIPSPFTINGDFVVNGVTSLILDNLIINGSVACDTGIVFSGANSTINASGSPREAAIAIESSSNSITRITKKPNIILGQNQRSAILAYSPSASIEVRVDTDIDPTYATSDQAAVIACTGSSGGEVTINIGNTAPVSVNGLIYAYSSNPAQMGNITVDNLNTEINGALVANGTVTLTDGKINWDSRPFVDATDTDTQIYQGFSGGRRVYLPVLGSWRQK